MIMNLKDGIRKIVELQEIDSKIYGLCQKKDKFLPEELAALKADFEEKKRVLESSTDKIKELQVKKKDRELELATKEEAVKKSQGQLYQLKTNKEYQAKLSEIASLKADMSLLEEEVLKVLEEIEKAEAELKEKQSGIAEQETKFKEDYSRIENQIKDIEAQAKTLQDKRGLMNKDVDPKILAKYEDLLQTRGGLAVVPVENHNCGACHMRVTPQTINEIKMYEGMVFCGSCLRLLYIPEDL